MRVTHPPFAKSANSDEVFLPASAIPKLMESWLLTGDIAQHSDRTLSSRRERVGKLIWFLNAKNCETCGLHDLRMFFQYLNHGHKEPGGRWGNPKMTAPLSSGRVKSYFSTLRTFFNFCVEEGAVEGSPMRRIPPTVDRPDQIQPFSQDQLRALLAAAKRSKANPKRDEALILLLLDTGIRASELCGLKRSDIDLQAGQVSIVNGKGGKTRHLPFSRDTKRAIYNMMNEAGTIEADAPLFLSERGSNAGGELTRNGLQQIIRRLAVRAKVSGVQCSPHTFRHTFAISFLRAGGNVFTLQQMLGHTSLSMTTKYVAIAQADMEAQHRRFSPVAALISSGKKG